MQEILTAARTCERPVIFFPPFVSSHHEDLDCLLFRESILRSLQQVFIPSQGHFVLVELCRGRAKIDIANSLTVACVSADNDEQPLSRARPVSSVGSDSRIVSKRASLKNVIPGTAGERWNVDVGVLFFDGPALQ